MKAVCIVQARMGSKRFPGKVAQLIAGKAVLTRVLERCKLIPGIDEVVCAVADTHGNETLLEIVHAAGVRIFPGSEHDPLSRTFGAAHMMGAEIVMRVTSDCPLIDPEICGLVLKTLRDNTTAMYVSNVLPRTFPQGLDCEVMTEEALYDAHTHAFSSYDREHTTPYIARKVSRPHLNVQSEVDRSKMRWVLDYPADLRFLRAVYEHGDPTSLDAALAIIEQFPHLTRANESVSERSL